MGNRAVITAWHNTNPNESGETGIYLHWNGGRDSVEAFLKYCELQGFRRPENDNYGFACLCGVIFNFFGDGLSLGIGPTKNLDCSNFDNGVYLIRDWKIVDRKEFAGSEQTEYTLLEMLLNIDKCQPQRMQLGETLIKEALIKEAYKSSN